MFLPKLEYSYPLYRPPSEANSLILQITFGCSWNKCAFCEMYQDKKFTIKTFEQIKSDIASLKSWNNQINKIFLADGDAMVLKTNKLLQILEEIKHSFPKIRRISSYAKPKDLKSKSLSELKELVDAGLNMVYVGAESGDTKLLEIINKGETFETTRAGLAKCKQAGIKTSVMILNGLGGLNYSRQHALNSAKLMNEVPPDFLSTLVLSFPYGLSHFKQKLKADFTELNKIQLLEELYLFLYNLKLDRTVFRSDHASNYLILKGILSKDKATLLEKLQHAVK